MVAKKTTEAEANTASAEKTATRKTKKAAVQMPAPERRRRRKKFSFRDGSKDIFFETEAEKFESEKPAASRSFTDLATGIKPRRYYPVRITGYRAVGTNGKCAIALYRNPECPEDSPVTIIIPYEEYTNYTDDDLRERRIKSRQVFLKNQIGNVIDVMPIDFRHASDKEIYFIGSRVEAMKKKAREYWFSYIAGTTDYRFNVGTVISARILDVFEKGIRVEVLGIEKTIPRQELSHTWITDARSKFKAGESVRVMITSLDRREGEGEDDWFVDYTASVKQAETDPHEIAATLIEPGDRTIGVIIRKVDREKGDGYVLVRPYDRDIDVYCPYPSEYDENFPFAEGSEVEIKYAKAKVTEDGRHRINAHMKHLIKY